MTVFIDATLALNWGPQISTGIPRVEIAIVRSAMERSDGDVKLFCFDSAVKQYRQLRTEEVAFVKWSLTAGDRFTPAAARLLSLRQRLREVNSIYAKNPTSARSAHRMIAQYLAASPERSGLKYQAMKALVRGRFALARRLRAMPDIERRDHALLSDPECRCLTSINTAYIGEKFGYANNLNGRITLIVYDTVPLDYPDMSVVDPDRFKSAFKRFVSRAATIIAISDATADAVRRWSDTLGIGIEGKPIRVVRLASPLHQGRTRPTPVTDLEGKRFVAYCSTIEPRKNHLLLLKVWSSLAREIGVDNLPMLVFVGRWGWKYDAVERMLREDKMLTKCVRVFSNLPDGELIWIYENAQYTVFPSIVEGWGLGAVESLACGTPVIIADTAALREATMGLMPTLRHDDEAGWKAIVGVLASDPERLAELRRIAREQYRAHAAHDDWDSVIDGLSKGGRGAEDATSLSGSGSVTDLEHIMLGAGRGAKRPARAGPSRA